MRAKSERFVAITRRRAVAGFGSFLLGPDQAFCGKNRLRWTHNIIDGKDIAHTGERLDDLDLGGEIHALADPDFELIDLLLDQPKQLELLDHAAVGLIWQLIGELEQGRAPLGSEDDAVGLAAGARHGCACCPP